MGQIYTGNERNIIPSRVMPGFLGTPAGMRTISAPVRACFKPLASGWYPVTTLLVLMWPISAATPTFKISGGPESISFVADQVRL